MIPLESGPCAHLDVSAQQLVAAVRAEALHCHSRAPALRAAPAPQVYLKQGNSQPILVVVT